MDLKIRDATPDDAAGIVGVFNPIIEAGCFTVFDTPLTVETERSYLAKLKERDIFHVALRVDDNSVVGFQSMEPVPTIQVPSLPARAKASGSSKRRIGR